MRGKACSAEFMRRLERMVAAHEGKHKDLVKFVTHQTCIKPNHTNMLLRSLELEKSLISVISEKPHPSILIECLSVKNPKALAIKAIEEGWTVDQTRKEAKRLKNIEIHKTVPPLPKGQYRTIVADPPWMYLKRSEDETHRGRTPYPTMPRHEIADMYDQWKPPLKDVFSDDAALWLWTTNAHVEEAVFVLKHWGFTYKTMLTWVKDKMGVGDCLRGKTEHCLLGVRGKPAWTLTNQTTVLHASRQEHSRKPDEFYDLAESLSPGPYVDLFARTTHTGWEPWGNEVGKFAA